MFRIAILGLTIVVVILLSYIFFKYEPVIDSNTVINKLNTRSYIKYSFNNLRKNTQDPTSLKIKSYNDNYSLLTERNKKSVNSLIRFPTKSGTYPIAILLRGYVDKEIYTSGIGTNRIAEFLSNNGYITIAPDFLGYGGSSPASKDSLEERFQTYTTVLGLLASLKNLNSALIKAKITDIKADTNRVALWGHSNGGHIALSVLAITGESYPTVLWAPVSKPFPYSVLYFTDEYPDNGKYLRKVIADFESNNDIEKYNPTNYYKWIKAPIQIHQGTHDDAVPLEWSNQLNETLMSYDINTEYYIYEGADHNLMPDGWTEAAYRTLDFINSEI